MNNSHLLFVLSWNIQALCVVIIMHGPTTQPQSSRVHSQWLWVLWQLSVNDSFIYLLIDLFIYLFTYSFIYLFTHTFRCLLCYLLSVSPFFSVFFVLIVYFTSCADFGLLPWKISMKKLDNPSYFSFHFVLSWKHFYKPHCLFLTLTLLHSVFLREFFPFV